MESNRVPREPGRGQTLRKALVAELAKGEYLLRPEVTRAFRTVPRHQFLPGVPQEQVYRDEAVAVELAPDLASVAARPAQVAQMIEQLDLHEGHSVLEVGSGTGYTAALLQEIVGRSGRVVSVELQEVVASRAKKLLARAGYGDVVVLARDGSEGAPEWAPFDRLLVSVGVADVAPAWRAQTALDGRLVIPLSIGGLQYSVAFHRRSEVLVSDSVFPSGFEPSGGVLADRDSIVEIRPGLIFWSEEERSPTREGLYRWLRTPGPTYPTGLHVTMEEVWAGVYQWLALHGTFCTLSAEGDSDLAALVPPLFEYFDDSGGTRFTGGLVSEGGLCLLSRGDESDAIGEVDGGEAFLLYVHGYGPDEPLRERTVVLVKEWEERGRPTGSSMRVRVYPRNSPYRAGPEEFVLPRGWSTIVVTFDRAHPLDQAC